ncbi:hypothetical protein K7X08_004239 [Anisodus acutangulus]|uniref:Uncharacterized protein n=1 Tax=Anisodus acutangulus TaxID=402998 RepID=A0A9Q1MK16_9SOLA|nr:hypothetical protein K7X08_004239 [Anisodus acutangulus]
MLESKETKCFGECPRSLEVIAHPTFNTWNRSNPLPLLVKLRLVRVLHLPDVELPSSWPSAVNSLTHLKYLNIYVQEFDFEWISDLFDLQTLLVHTSNTLIRTLPTAFWKMTKLRHVNIYRFPLARENMVWEENDRAIFEESSTTMLENLKTFLSNLRILVDDKTPRFWWRFPNVQALNFRIDDLPSCHLFPTSEVHTGLLSLDLVISPWSLWDSVGWESYFVFPSNLKELCIAGCFLTKRMVLSIARLKKLESLTLQGGFPWRQRKYHCWDVTNVKFPALKYLKLEQMRMDEWKASEESFPVLEKLFIRSGYYKEIPPSFADIPTLRLIKLSDYGNSLGVSAKNIQKEVEECTGCDYLQVLMEYGSDR